MSSPSAPSPPNRRNVRQTLRRGGTALGLMIGDYFGVTEQSQTVSGGWNDVARRRSEGVAAGFGTLGRRRSDDPPDYNTLEMGNIPTNMQSFDPNDLSDDSSEGEDVYTQNPAHARSDRVSQGQGRVISMFGHEDPDRAQAITRPQHRPVEDTNGGQNVGGANNTITDPERGVRYYLEYIRAEKIVKRRQNNDAASEFFGGGRERSMSGSGEGGFRGRLNSSVDPAEMRRKKQKKTGRSKLERQNTLVREELESLPTFWPIFILGVTFIQLCVVVVLMVLNGFAPFDYQPQQRTSNYPSLVNISGNASVTYYEFTNLWFGIDLLNLIHSGAKFSPCMRKDVAIINRNIQQRNREKESGGLGCCQNKIWVGTVLEEDCVTSSGSDINTSSIEFLNTPCKDTTRLLANFHPCCISITGQCQVMHVRECLDRGGVYHSDKDSCNDTNCLDSICGISGIGTENNDPLRPSGSQLWRLITAMFIHLGVIHWLVIAIVQLYLGIKIEITVGFVRIALIYIISGVGGNLMSAIFIPYQVNGGASPSVFGLLGVVFVELFQFWQVVEHAWLEVVKLSSIFIFLLAFGTLPFIDNLANIGGFIFGIPTAIVFLPYITFGKVDAWRKRILLIICIPVLILMFAVGLIVFYLVPDTDFCEGCHYFNCIPYTSSFCQNEVSDPNPEIFAL